MKFDTTITYVNKVRIENKDTGESLTLCKVTVQTPIAKSDKNPYEFGSVGKDYYVKEEYYNLFKEALAKGTKINVIIGFKKTFDKLSKKSYYKDYLAAIDGKEL